MRNYKICICVNNTNYVFSVHVGGGCTGRNVTSNLI